MFHDIQKGPWTLKILKFQAQGLAGLPTLSQLRFRFSGEYSSCLEGKFLCMSLWELV